MSTLFDGLADISILPMGWIMLITVAAMPGLSAICLLLRRFLSHWITPDDMRALLSEFELMAGRESKMLR